MIIRKLTASFGKLSGDVLEFNDGLNVIYAPNESGKSTWCAFIRAMLYGIDTSERSKVGKVPDKTRYAPWSGAPMQGSMEVCAGGKEITLTRSSPRQNLPMREFSAVYSGTAVEVEGISGENAGEMLTGVGRDVFRRSAFVEQGSIAVSGTPELEKRINSIVSSGEENVSFTDADEVLRSWQRKRRYNGCGVLPGIENEMDEIRSRISDLENSENEIEELNSQLLEAKRKVAELEDSVTESRKIRRKDSLERLATARKTLQRVDDERAKAAEKYNECLAVQHSHFFAGQPLDEVRAEVQADTDEAERLQAVIDGKSVVTPVFVLVAFVLAAVSAALYVSRGVLLLAVCAGVLLALGIILLTKYIAARKVIRKASSEKKEILKKYGASVPNDIYTLLEGYSMLCEETVKAKQRELFLKNKYEEGRERLEGVERSVIEDLDFVGGNTEAARLTAMLSSARTEEERINSRLSALKGRVSASGDLSVLKSSLAYLREKYDELEQEYREIDLAVSVLRQADDELQSRFCPELGKLAAEYMSRMTGGKYSDVLIGKDFSAAVKTEDETVARGGEYLSAGTADLLYLAVRLAVCRLAMPSGEPCPLIIDDALVNFDDERRDAAMELLRQIAGERQVILFTCRPLNS